MLPTPCATSSAEVERRGGCRPLFRGAGLLAAARALGLPQACNTICSFWPTGRAAPDSGHSSMPERAHTPPVLP